MKNIELEEKQTQLEAAKLYISGAIRKVTNHMEQYNSILSSIGVKSIDEVDFEKEEERYHIMKAFEQALCAARSHGGIIDEGNHIYLYQVGINGFVAQYELTKYLLHEAELAKKGQEPSHGMVLMFMEQMAQKFSGCSKVFAHRKGMTGEISERASIKALVQ